MTRILFAPLSITGGLIAGLAATRLFEFIWARFDDQEAPDPELLLQGAIFRFVRGAFDHGARVVFFRGTRSWPGAERPEAT
jgi:hypothetical protein